MSIPLGFSCRENNCGTFGICNQTTATCECFEGYEYPNWFFRIENCVQPQFLKEILIWQACISNLLVFLWFLWVNIRQKAHQVKPTLTHSKIKFPTLYFYGNFCMHIGYLLFWMIRYFIQDQLWFSLSIYAVVLFICQWNMIVMFDPLYKAVNQRPPSQSRRLLGIFTGFQHGANFLISISYLVVRILLPASFQLVFFWSHCFLYLTLFLIPLIVTWFQLRPYVSRGLAMNPDSEKIKNLTRQLLLQVCGFILVFILCLLIPSIYLTVSISIPSILDYQFIPWYLYHLLPWIFSIVCLVWFLTKA